MSRADIAGLLDMMRSVPQPASIAELRAVMEMSIPMIDAYLPGGSGRDDPRASPLHADLSHFPPACLLCGTWDPLLGESLAMHAKLQQAGRVPELHKYPEMPHAFLQLCPPEADSAIQTGCAFLRTHLAE